MSIICRVNEDFVIYNTCSNRGANSRISRIVTGLSSSFLFAVLIERDMPTVTITGKPYANCVNQQLPTERDGLSLSGRGEPMKPLFDAVVLTVRLNMAKAISLYHLGGVIGLSLGAAELVAAFSANSLKRRATKP